MKYMKRLMFESIKSSMSNLGRPMNDRLSGSHKNFDCEATSLQTSNFSSAEPNA